MADEQGLVGRQVSRVVGVVVPPVIDSIDVQALIDEVDLNALLDEIDVEALIARIDLNTLLDNIDLNALLDNIDLDALMDKIDLEGLMRKANIGEIVAESTGQVAGSALDLLRRPVVGLDVILMRFINGLLRRKPDDLPVGPPLLQSVWEPTT